MDSREVDRIIGLLAGQRTATLETFFTSQGLQRAFRSSGDGWGREKRVNDALAEADRQGRRDEVLAEAAARFGGETMTGPESRQDPVDHLEAALQAARDLSVGDFDEAERVLAQARMVTEQLFGESSRHRARLTNIRFRESTVRERLDRVRGTELWQQAQRKLVAELSATVDQVRMFGLPGDRSSTTEAAPLTVEPTGDKRSVFVIHGRDGAAWAAMFTFLRALDLQSIEWSQAREETKHPSPYVAKVLEAGFRKAQAFVVLLTPDDEAKLREDFLEHDHPEYEQDLTPQARPNVLFEAGMAMGAAPERTVLVQIGHVRPFSDIGGRLVLRFDGSSPDGWKGLAQRLSSAGCEVSMTGEDWLTAGEFPVR